MNSSIIISMNNKNAEETARVVLQNTQNITKQSHHHMVTGSKETLLRNDHTHLNPSNQLLDPLKSQPSSEIKISDKNDVRLVKNFAYVVCREYLSGAWKNIGFDEFQIERVTMGQSNYLYACSIRKDSFKQIENEPNRVLLRLYGESKNFSVQITQMVSVMISDFNLGPKLYGIFPTGSLEQFINANSMEVCDMYVPEFSREIAKVTAKFHTLEMPFNKEAHWLFDTTKKNLDKIGALNEQSFFNEKDQSIYKQILSYNFDSEFEKLKQILYSVNSPVVFCHNDINVGNILKLPKKLMLIDYDYVNYNYRGYDLGNHFCEWMMNNNHDQPPYFQYNYDRYPNREQQLHFVRAYIEQYKNTVQQRYLERRKRSDDTEEENEDETNENQSQCNLVINHFESKNLNEEHLLKEANYFALASSFFWTQWAVLQASSRKINFEFMDYALVRCDSYFKHKQALFPNGFE